MEVSTLWKTTARQKQSKRVPNTLHPKGPKSIPSISLSDMGSLNLGKKIMRIIPSLTIFIFIFILISMAQDFHSNSHGSSITGGRRLLIHTQQRQSPPAHGDRRLRRLLHSGFDDHGRFLIDEPRKQSPAAHGDRRVLDSGSDDHSRVLMDEPPKQSPAAHGDRRRRRRVLGSGSNDHSRLLMDEPRKQSPAAHGDRRRRLLASRSR